MQLLNWSNSAPAIHVSLPRGVAVSPCSNGIAHCFVLLSTSTKGKDPGGKHNIFAYAIFWNCKMKRTGREKAK